jgi:hypothetical protein
VRGTVLSDKILVRIMDSRTPTYLLFDPQHVYAAPLMQALERSHGLRPVCIYTQRKFEVYNRESFPHLRTDAVLEHIYLEDWKPDELAAALSRTYCIVAAVPLTETTVLPAALLSLHFDTLRDNADVLQRFRDKAGLKQYLRATAPHVPMNETYLVHSAAEVFARKLPKRYILKPNAGYGSAAIGFFYADSPRVDVQAYFAKNGPGAYVLEDFLDGVEYAINGQVCCATSIESSTANRMSIGAAITCARIPRTLKQSAAMSKMWCVPRACAGRLSTPK